MIISFNEGKPSRNLWAKVLGILFIFTVIVNEITNDDVDILMFPVFSIIGWLVFGSWVTDRYIRKLRENNK